jgi:hypothetical protein
VRVLLAYGVVVLAMLVGVVVVLSAERSRMAGTNNVFDLFGNVPVGPGQEACARDELVPGDTAAVRVHAVPEAPPGGLLELRMSRDGRELARGTLAAGWTGGQVDVPIRPLVAGTEPDVTLCFTNGDDGAVTLWGYGAAPTGPRMVVDGNVTNERTRLTYVRPGRESGWELVGLVARRMGIVRGDLLHGWAFFGWIAAIGGAFVVAAVAVLRGLRT